MFGSIFTTRLSESLTNAFTGAGASAEQASQSTRTMDPQMLSQLPAQLQGRDRQRLRGFARARLLVPAAVPGHRPDPGLTLKQIPLSDTAGMVARGEAVGGEEAERLEAERAAARHSADNAGQTHDGEPEGPAAHGSADQSSHDDELTRLRG